MVKNSDQIVSSHDKRSDRPNSRQVFFGEFVVKIQQLVFQIFEIITLRPMVRVCIQIPEKATIRFSQVGERFTCWHPIDRVYCIVYCIVYWIALGRGHRSFEPIRSSS